MCIIPYQSLVYMVGVHWGLTDFLSANLTHGNFMMRMRKHWPHPQNYWENVDAKPLCWGESEC